MRESGNVRRDGVDVSTSASSVIWKKRSIVH
jgi:hypothetical protein